MNERYFEDLFETFSTNGWKSISDQAQEQVESLKETLVNTTDNNQSQYIRGYIGALRAMIVNLPLVTENSLAQYKEENDATL